MSKSKKKNKKQKPIEVYYETIGDTVSPGIAYLQAASLLDLAAVAAVQYGDPEAMGSVAHQWMEMAMLMQGGKPHDEEPDDATSETRVIGFGTTAMREVAENDARKSSKS